MKSRVSTQGDVRNRIWGVQGVRAASKTKKECGVTIREASSRLRSGVSNGHVKIGLLQESADQIRCIIETCLSGSGCRASRFQSWATSNTCVASCHVIVYIIYPDIRACNQALHRLLLLYYTMPDALFHQSQAFVLDKMASCLHDEPLRLL